MGKGRTDPGTIRTNRQARRTYDVMETFEAGISLVGSEVKPTREGRISFGDGHVVFRQGSAFLVGVRIDPPAATSLFDRADPGRDRRLLLRKGEIAFLETVVCRKGLAVVPLAMRLSGSKVKVVIGLCRGKNAFSRKQEMRERDLDREAARQLAEKRR